MEHLKALDALKKAREDINWMLNSQQFLSAFVFDYLDKAIANEEDAEYKKFVDNN